MAHESHTIEAMVCGYHLYIGVLLLGKSYHAREVENHCDPLATAVVPSLEAVYTILKIFLKGV